MKPLPEYTSRSLPWVVAAALPALLACDAEPQPAPPASGRVQAVIAKVPGADALAGFCDVQTKSGQGAPIALPAMAGVERAGEPPAEPSVALPVARGPRWINLWATWCRPCLDELPMIGRWRDTWRERGSAPVISLISVDKSQEDLDAFREQHPGTPADRFADPDALGPFMAALGLDPGAGLPLHIFTDQQDRPTCVRAGAVVEDHRPLVEQLLTP